MLKFKSSPEAARRRKHHHENAVRYSTLPNKDLSERAEYYMKNSAGGVLGVKWLPGEPVYDAVMVHTIIPEMIKRLKSI